MLNLKQWFIREHVGILKFSNMYDILDPSSKKVIGFAKEEVPAWNHLLRLIVSKQMLPTSVRISEGGDENNPGNLLFEIKRGFNIGFRTKVDILNSKGEIVGYFQKVVLSLGGKFLVFNASGTQVATLAGDWKGWDFRFTDSAGKELGRVSKEWSGLGKELFTTADNYIVSINEENPALAILLLAAGLAIDTIFKEN
ncbi:MAG: oxidoreductase [Fibrobacteres bacterium]|nr:oxidoreductase [Fibrobacterota bacterium]